MGNVPSTLESDSQQQEQQQPEQQQQQQQQQQENNNNSNQQQKPPKDKKDKKEKKEKQQQQQTDDSEDLLTFSPEDMKEQEDACAACDRECEVLEYPQAITDKIDRNFVLHNSSTIARWNVLVTTDQSASKWPHDCFQGDWFPTSVNNAANNVDVGKVRVSVITRGPESGCNAEEAVDLFFFPEFIKYNDVERTHLDALFKYHTTVIAPRHQESLKTQGSDEKKEEKVLDEEQQAQLDALTPIPSSKTPSTLFKPYDRVEFGVGTQFPFPIDMYETTFVTLCGHTLRDKRCGVTAPILKEQFNIVLDQKYPESSDKVTIDLVSHVGGHKVAGNCIIHGKGFGTVFYGRVFPDHVENIVDKTVMKGEILKPITRACHTEAW